MKKRRKGFGNEIERRRIYTVDAREEGDEGRSSFLLERQNVGDDAFVEELREPVGEKVTTRGGKSA